MEIDNGPRNRIVNNLDENEVGWKRVWSNITYAAHSTGMNLLVEKHVHQPYIEAYFTNMKTTLFNGRKSTLNNRSTHVVAFVDKHKEQIKAGHQGC